MNDLDLLLQSERAVLGSLLLDQRMIREVLPILRPGDFEDHRLGRVYEGIVEMFQDGIAVDVITVSDRLLRWDIRGIEVADLHVWTSEVPTAASAAFYAEQVRDGALRRGMRMVAQRLLRDSVELEPALALQRAFAALEGLSADAAHEGIVSKPLAVLTEDDGEPDYQWVIEGLLERGDRLLVTGGEGGGKTTLLRQIAITSGAGLHPFTFQPIPPVRVLFVDAENTERQWKRNVRGMILRARMLGSDPGQTVRFANTPRLDLTLPGDLLGVHRMVDEHDPGLLIIGPLYRLIPRAINSDDDAVPLLAALDSLRDRGLALIIEAHAGHAVGVGGDRELRPRGSSALLGWPEFGMGLRRDRDNASAYSLIRWRGDRDARRWPLRLARGMPNDWPWTPTRFTGEGQS